MHKTSLVSRFEVLKNSKIYFLQFIKLKKPHSGMRLFIIFQ